MRSANDVTPFVNRDCVAVKSVILDCLCLQHSLDMNMLISRPGRASLQVVARESRIGSKPIVLPKGVSVNLDGVTMKVKVRKRLMGGGDRMRLAWGRHTTSRHWSLIA